jgi:hypothetical protein
VLIVEYLEYTSISNYYKRQESEADPYGSNYYNNSNCTWQLIYQVYWYTACGSIAELYVHLCYQYLFIVVSILNYKLDKVLYFFEFVDWSLFTFNPNYHE